MPAESSHSRCRIGTFYCDVRTLHSRMWVGHTLRNFYRVAQIRKCDVVPHRSEARTAVAGESFILCQNYVCIYVCTHVGRYLYMYIIQPRFHMCQSSLLWAGVIIGYGLWIAGKKTSNLHAVDIATCNIQGFSECLSEWVRLGGGVRHDADRHLWRV
jgi:hypothetical protein